MTMGVQSSTQDWFGWGQSNAYCANLAHPVCMDIRTPNAAMFRRPQKSLELDRQQRQFWLYGLCIDSNRHVGDLTIWKFEPSLVHMRVEWMAAATPAWIQRFPLRSTAHGAGCGQQPESRVRLRWPQNAISGFSAAKRPITPTIHRTGITTCGSSTVPRTYGEWRG